MLGKLGDAHVIGVASLVLHVGEDVDGVLTEDGVEGDEGLEDGAPLELIETAHAVQDGREGRLLDGGERTGGEGFFGTVENVLELREFEGLGQDGDFGEEESVVALRLLDVYGEGFGRPDAAGCEEITLREIDRAG